MKQIWIDEDMSALLGKQAYFVDTSDNHAMTAVNAGVSLNDDTKDKRVLNMHHPMNSICLRQDLSWAWDNGEFVFMPDGNRWVAYFLDPTSELRRLFDHSLVRISQELPKPFLMFRATMFALRLSKSFLDPSLLREEVKERMLQYSLTTYLPNPRKPLPEEPAGPEHKDEERVEPERMSVLEKAKRVKAALKEKSKKAASAMATSTSTQLATQLGEYYPFSNHDQDNLPGPSKGKGKGKQAVSSTRAHETWRDRNEDNGETSQANHMITFDEPVQPERSRTRDMKKVFRPKDNPFSDDNVI
jgi:hypothetical protein